MLWGSTLKDLRSKGYAERERERERATVEKIVVERRGVRTGGKDKVVVRFCLLNSCREST